MAEDYRRITLNPKEFLFALDAHRRSKPDFLPCGEILGYTVLPEESLNVTVKMTYGKNVSELVLTYKFVDFLPALVKFCVENNIVLPGAGRRFVTHNDDKMALVIVDEA